MAGMMAFPKRSVPPVGEDADPAKRIGGQTTAPMLPDRDGPARRDMTAPKKHQVKPPKAKKAPSVPAAPKPPSGMIAGMRASLKER